ncbi:non-ribosomal peptide synthetase [Micromonospora sp. NPDC002296]|uniref:non-ribosomal peptide synthetase n=1 Tax=Micromonospora sp. NPDC002296 TaxID=3154271 RepID=UPI0033337646
MTGSADAPVVVDTLPGLFRAAVRAHPDRPAVSDGDRRLTYAELDRESDAVASGLRARGVAVEDRVGLYAERSVDLLVAVLGILKAGAAYVAVDSRYPDARRDLMLHTSGAKLIICAPGWLDRLREFPADVVTLAEVTRSEPAPMPAVEPASAANVLFTSGSSGQPKAIVLEHRNLVSLALNPGLPQLTPADRSGQISSVSFDAFNMELWTALAVGAEVVVLPDVPDLLAADFQRQLRRYGVTVMVVPTMVVNQVVRADRDAFAPLRLVRVGGDVLQPSACRDLLGGRFSGELYNMYGPAEITTACTSHLVTMADAESDLIPIGRPLSGVTAHVLSPDLRPTADGEIGELFVAGPGVARGYQDQPGLTEERFRTITGDDGGPVRAYRTGDLVRRRPDGVLEFVGRADDQVRIRGYRVEPGEVERGLRRQRQVQEAAVLPDGTADDRRLIAVVVVDGTPSVAELRAQAERDLPDFMVPSHFIVVPQIPATDHGKRDMAALRELLDAHRQRRDSYLPPGTDTERYLVELWERLLGVENVGRNENFFALGGHSLQAFQMHRRISRDLGVKLPFQAMLSNTVLADLAALIDQSVAEGEPG